MKMYVDKTANYVRFCVFGRKTLFMRIVKMYNLWYGTASKYSFENGQAASDNHIIADVLHDAGRLTSHQSEQDRGWGEKRHKLFQRLFTDVLKKQRAHTNRNYISVSHQSASNYPKPQSAAKERSCHLYRGSRRGKVRPDSLWWSRRDRTGSRWDPRTRGQNTTPPSDREEHTIKTVT